MRVTSVWFCFVVFISDFTSSAKSSKLPQQNGRGNGEKKRPDGTSEETWIGVKDKGWDFDFDQKIVQIFTFRNVTDSKNVELIPSSKDHPMVALSYRVNRLNPSQPNRSTDEYWIKCFGYFHIGQRSAGKREERVLHIRFSRDQLSGIDLNKDGTLAIKNYKDPLNLFGIFSTFPGEDRLKLPRLPNLDAKAKKANASYWSGRTVFQRVEDILIHNSKEIEKRVNSRKYTIPESDHEILTLIDYKSGDCSGFKNKSFNGLQYFMKVGATRTMDKKEEFVYFHVRKTEKSKALVGMELKRDGSIAFKKLREPIKPIGMFGDLNEKDCLKIPPQPNNTPFQKDQKKWAIENKKRKKH